jgi:hypothetical protein
MNRRSHQRGQIMLIILGTLFLGAGAATGVFTSGKSIESMRKDVRGLQLDAIRQQRIYDLLDRWEDIADPAAQGFEAYGESLLALMRRQNASREEFEAVLGRQRSELAEAERRLLPLRDEMRAALTEEQWNQLFR